MSQDDVYRAYRDLGIEPGFDFDEILDRYRFLVRTLHPDKVRAEDKAKADAELKKINNARDILKAHFDGPEHSATGFCFCRQDKGVPHPYQSETQANSSTPQPDAKKSTQSSSPVSPDVTVTTDGAGSRVIKLKTTPLKTRLIWVGAIALIAFVFVPRKSDINHDFRDYKKPKAGSATGGATPESAGFKVLQVDDTANQARELKADQNRAAIDKQIAAALDQKKVHVNELAQIKLLISRQEQTDTAAKYGEARDPRRYTREDVVALENKISALDKRLQDLRAMDPQAPGLDLYGSR